MANRISVPTSDFKNAVSAIEKFIPGTTPINSLKNVHFSVKNNSITLTASDAVVMASATIAMDIPFDMEEFVVLADAQRMIKFVQSLDSENIVVEPNLSTSKIVLKSSKRRTTLNTVDANEYIKVDFDEPSERISVDPTSFSGAVKLMSGYHLPYNDPKISMWRGVELLICQDGFRLTATDSFVGTVYQYGSVENANKIVIMGDQIGDVAKVSISYEKFEIGIPEPEDTKLFLYGSSGNVSVKTSIQVLDILNEYPDMRKFFDGYRDSNMTIIKVSKSILASALKPSEPYDSDKISILTDRPSALRMIIEDEQLGEYTAEVEFVDSENYDYKNPILLGINKRFLKRAIGNVSSDNLEFMISEDVPVAMFVPESDDKDIYYIQAVARMV